MDDRPELSAALRSAERPREFTAVEYDRVLERIALAMDAPGGQQPLDDVVSIAAAGRSSRPRRSGWWVAAAAATIVAVVSVAVLLGRREEALAPTSPPVSVETLPPAPVEWCATHFDPIVDALTRWRGLENWAWTGGVPDVGGLASDALRSFADVVPSAGERAAAGADALAADLAAIVDGGFDQRTVSADRVAAVAPALDVIAELAADVGCGVAALDAVR